MPLAEKTFYNLKRLHVVFAVASLAMLATTLWMLAADHWREWKGYQRTFRNRVEPWTTEAALGQAESDDFAARERLDRALAGQRPSFGKWLFSLPLLDAFGRPLAIEQIWLPELGINYNFREVGRLDRCITCHLGIDKTAAGSPSEPAYVREKTVQIQLAAPAGPPKVQGEDDGRQTQLREAYGFALAAEGILESADVTLGLVLPKTPAARAGLRAGDVILAVGGQVVSDRADLERLLLDEVAWGKPLPLEVRRGLPRPYSSHPRLDLFVAERSPHPAPQFGCTVCHGGQGSATEFKFASHTPNDPGQRAGWRKEHGWFWNHDWDFPMRPRRFIESGCLKCHHGVTELEPGPRFRDPPAPKLLEGYHLVRQLGCFGCHEIRGVSETGERIGPDMRLEPAAASAPGPNPGTMRKVGPSLRGVAGKLDSAFIAAWVADPAGFRPTTRMPQLFEMREHLDGPGLEMAARLEPVEIRAAAEYLLAASQPVATLDSPPEVTEAPSAERGKRLFRIQGCLACHRHRDFPEGQSTQGPDLSRLGAKLRSPAAHQWLVSWIRDPVRHSPRTLMPNSLLVPIAINVGPHPNPLPKGEGTSAGGNKPRFTDPAADIAAYLVTSGGWEPRAMPALVEADLDELAVLYLSKTFPKQLAVQYLREGVPKSAAGESGGDADELSAPVTREKKLRYVGRRTIHKRGCFGCHDIPGFEGAQGIGPALSDWGRKQESLLAFEQIASYLAFSERQSGSAGPAAGDGTLSADDYAFYREAVLAKRREGFLWQKLRAPRSFDYQKTAGKGFHEQLLMGKFALSDRQREAIITFVLGLVAEPPRPRYVFRPDPRGQAIVEGRKVLDQYGCAQCHTLEMERWTIEYDPAKFPAPPPMPEHNFLKPQVTEASLAGSRASDRRGLAKAEMVGMPQLAADGKPEETEDEDGNLQYAFTLWEPAAIAGRVWPVGGAGVLVSPRDIAAKQPARGGDFARLLYPVALAEAKASGSTAAVVEAWGWVPPALVHEGRRVQPAWLHAYLLDPPLIRPASVLRMPKFSLSPAEASKLVEYFAAVDGVEFPYSFDPLARDAQRVSGPPQQGERLDRAMRFLTDRTTYCAKCHLVGDYSPGGEIRTVLAPNLERVASRIRPDYLRRWLASPKSLLPYTAMPVNFPPGERRGQDLYPGPSLEQLDAVMDLLLDYDGYVRRRVSIRQMIEAREKGK